MKPLEKKIILGADGKTMVYVYDGDVDYQPTKTTTNYKYSAHDKKSAPTNFHGFGG